MEIEAPLNDKDLPPGFLNQYARVKLDSSSGRSQASPHDALTTQVKLDSSSGRPQELADDGSIGEFYERLRYDLAEAAQGDKGLFLSASVPKQLKNEGKENAYHIKNDLLVPIGDWNAANRALETIVAQGEGASSALEPGSHYTAFKKIYDEYDEHPLAYYDVVTNPDAELCETEKFHPVMVACDAAYSYSLLIIERLWQYEDADQADLVSKKDGDRADFVRQNLRLTMTDVVRPIAEFLVQQTFAFGEHKGRHAGPGFRKYNFKQEKPLEQLKTRVDEALKAYPSASGLIDARRVLDSFLYDVPEEQKLASHT